ncbi:MAG: HPr(Ser) kinase/phosphatase [Clostridiales bacterium]|nr:HPr(Ser) kinase/phosphatase [Clostridiales bacterium]
MPKTIPVEVFADKIDLKTVFKGRGEFVVHSNDISRPSIQMAGYFKEFPSHRIQLFGRQEMGYIEQCSEADLEARFTEFFSYNIPCVVVCNGDPVPNVMMRHAMEHNVPVFTTKRSTSKIVHMVVDLLDAVLAPEETLHANVLNVYNVGVLVRGESGIGKSELTLELIKRGHFMVSDDVTVLRKLGESRLVGYAPPAVRNLMEVRGIGIIDAKLMFGLTSVLESSQVDVYVELSNWVEGQEYERLGFDTEYIEFMGVKIPRYDIPVRPGRNLAALVEAIAMNFRVRQSNYDIEKEVNRRLEALYSGAETEVIL